MPDVPTLTQELADEIAKVAKQQLQTSRQYKQARMLQIEESEKLYAGIVEKQIKNPFNISFPFMSGFVEHYRSKIDDGPTIEYGHTDEADYKVAKMVTAAWETESTSVLPHAKWAYKDRTAKVNAIFSGRAIYKYWSSREGGYKSNFETVDYKDFHCEPDGGGHLGRHMFAGEENIFKTEEDLEDGAKRGIYDVAQVRSLITHVSTGNEGYKETDPEKQARQYAVQLDPVTHNYIGQKAYRLNEWYLMYKGVWWYCLFDEPSGLWIRLKPLRDIITSDLHPYVSWATHENYRLFWSKGPCDDARPIANYLNKALAQELYNREKMNRGVRGYDPEMITDVEALADWRPDSLVPVNTFKGSRPVNTGVYEFNVAGLNGTIDLVTFVDQFASRQMGITPGAQGSSEDNKKVGIFFGELQQVDDFIGTKNKSYKEAWAELGLRFFHGLEDNLTNEGMAIKVMGTNGIEWTTLKKRDLKHNRDFDIKVTGGADEAQINEVEAQKRMAALSAVVTVNPEWKDRQMLKNGGFTDEEIKEAFTMLPAASQELMSEAAEAIQHIEQGKPVELNQGANAAFMQKIIDYATNLSLDDKEEEFAIRDALYEYAMAHVDIAASNEARSAAQLLQERQIAANTPGAAAPPNPPMPAGTESAALKKNPVGAAVSLGLRATNAVTR